METEIHTYYRIENGRSRIFGQLAEQLKDEFLKQPTGNPYSTPEGCRFLHTVRSSDLIGWSPQGIRCEGELTPAESSMVEKVLYMRGTRHTSFSDAVNMLKRIATKGARGCLNGKRKYPERREGETAQDFIRRSTGHFYHNFKVWKLTEQDVASIRNVLVKNNLL
jgi:hypothetical protein